MYYENWKCILKTINNTNVLLTKRSTFNYIRAKIDEIHEHVTIYRIFA